MEWEAIVPGRGYVDLSTGDVLVVTKVTKTRVTLDTGRTMNIWDFRMRVMPSGSTTAADADSPAGSEPAGEHQN